jgi:uncharacterized membrane protein YdjX (TVP38/TMEM64 family)
MDSREPAQAGVSRRTAFIRLGAYGLVVGSILLTLLLTGSIPSADEARDWVDGLGNWVYIAFVPLFVVTNFVIWWPILAGAAGLLFGTAVGTVLVLIAVTCSSVTQMFVARRLAAGHHGNLLPQRTRRIEQFLTRYGAVAVMESRIVPALPWGLVNFSAGLTHMRYRDMAFGTVVGAAPKVFAYTALGGHFDDLWSPQAIVAIVLLVTLAILGALFVRHQVALGRA